MRVKVRKREKFQAMSTGALQYLFRGHRDEAEQPEMEKKQPNAGGKPGECGTLETKRKCF